MGTWIEGLSAFCALGTLALGLYVLFGGRNKKRDQQIIYLQNEVRWLQQCTGHSPFNSNWDR